MPTAVFRRVVGKFEKCNSGVTRLLVQATTKQWMIVKELKLVLFSPCWAWLLTREARSIAESVT
jgi:hypothetical protein